MPLRALHADGEFSPYRIERDHEAVIPWAITDNGDAFYWVTDRSGEPDEWTVAINEARGIRWASFDGSATECLVALLSKSIRVGLFPEDFPSEQPTFRAAST